MADKLPLDAKINLISKMVDDLAFYTEAGVCPGEQEFKIVSGDEDSSLGIAARTAAFKEMQNTGLKKVAFDTRRIDQEHDRNPRRNLQNWHRSEDFIDTDTANKVEVLTKLESVASEIKDEFSECPSWHDSYVRMLCSNLDRVKIKHAGNSDYDVFKPHVSYLEQLLFNRYRLTLDNIKNATNKEIKEILLNKDSELKVEGPIFKSSDKAKPALESNAVSAIHQPDAKTTMNPHAYSHAYPPAYPMYPPMYGAYAGYAVPQIIKSAPDEVKHDSLAALMQPIRPHGERSVERTITIKIVDSVID